MTVREHLASRHVEDPDFYSAHVDEEEGVVTFPLWNLGGQYSGYQRYRPAAGKVKNNDPVMSRYYTQRPKGGLGVFGLETWNRPGPAFVQEGIFDAVRLHSMGLPAIATLSNDPLFLDEWFYLTGRPLFSFLDGGSAGALMKKYVHRWYELPAGVDAASASDDLLKNALTTYFFC